MRPSLNAIALSTLALAAQLPLPALAGVVDRYAPNKAFLVAQSQVSFIGGLSTVGLSTTHTGIASTLGDPGYVNDVFATRTMPPPFSGDTKDQATGDINVHFVAGSGAADDTFAFTTNATASAVNAFNAAGDASAARVRLFGSFSFFLDAGYGGVPGGTVVGHLTFDALPAALPFESYNILVMDGSAVAGTASAGSGPLSLGLQAGHGYQAYFTYTLDVPHGIDPVYALTFGGTVSGVPEPASAALALGGLLMLGARRARQRRA